MQRLGHDKFYCQGGDWGAFVTQALSTLHPEHVLGLHLNMFTSNTLGTNLKLMVSQFFPSLILEPQDYPKVLNILDKYKFILEETGYMHIQATKPDTVGECFSVANSISFSKSRLPCKNS